MFSRSKLVAVLLGALLATARPVVAAEPVACDPASPPAVPGAMVWQHFEGWVFEPCEPLWTASAEALFLNRSKPAYQTLLICNCAKPIFDANQFDFPVQFGGEIDVRRRLVGDWSVEARWFGVSNRSANAEGSLTNNGAGVLYNSPSAATGIFGAGQVASRLNYSSQLQDAEINIRKEINCDVTLLAGVRFLALYDDGLDDRSEGDSRCCESQPGVGRLQ